MARKTVFRTGAAIAMLVASLAIGAGAALAEDGAVPTLGGADAASPPPGWVSACSAPSRDGPLECRMEQRAVLKQTGQLVASVTIRVPADTKKPVLLVRVPLGLSLEAGVTLDVDGAKGRSLPLQTCDAGGCYAGSPLPADFLAALQKGNTLDLIFQNLDKAPIKLQMPLAGFSDAYSRIH
ncbi:invasion-associated locus B family protein [Kaistia algarum]|uniref:invasion associated locus B family protein n=1 Tax=Kaistia algarum TaxID=2083279 RepID=UPI000CE77E91|nr:invasion associated locus B family protein [Kaistia algarum]MCX5512302.1 invasion associated locus B family protein [Kaistia algarum]PPE80393.1 invasion-associated locus B family protein [Kaistia algarum]